MHLGWVEPGEHLVVGPGNDPLSVPLLLVDIVPKFGLVLINELLVPFGEAFWEGLHLHSEEKRETKPLCPLSKMSVAEVSDALFTRIFLKLTYDNRVLLSRGRNYR